MTKMNYLSLKRPELALRTYRELLSYTKVSTAGRSEADAPRFVEVLHGPDAEQNNVTRNYAEKSINNILDYVGGEGKVRFDLLTRIR